MRESHKTELTFVSISPDRSFMSPACSRLQLHQSVDRDRWEGVSPETVGRPQGLRPHRAAPGDFAYSQEQRFTQQLAELALVPDLRPPLLRFFPAKENQLATEAVQTHTYSKGNFLQQHQLMYRAYNTDSRLVRSILELAGFYPTDSHDWNVLWLNSTPLEYLFKGLNEYQRINHFPKTSEITRKDRFCMSISRMKTLHGLKTYKFVPDTFVLPHQKNEFAVAYEEKKCAWITKPCASSQGRGIYLLESTEAILPSEPCVVSRYIGNPLLVNGLKFDLRLYVLISCFCPLRVYVYEEGLARFACESYESVDVSKSRFMHLTNYSVNKKSDLFQQNQDARQDNVGHKWSLSALCKHLESIGADVPLLWARIYSLVIKTVLAIEEESVATIERLGLHRGNCFDLLGFDVLIDEHLKPWLLEVNLSPSLAVDSPLDLHVKGNLIADMLTLIGIRAFNRKGADISKIRSRLRAHKKTGAHEVKSLHQCKEMLRETLEEYERRGHFIRIYPAYRCEVYDSLFASLRMENKWVYAVLFQGQSALLMQIATKEDAALSTSMLDGSISHNSHPNRPRRNLSTAAESSSFLPSLCVRKSAPRSERLLLTDVLIEYFSQLSEALKDTPDIGTKPLWKQRIESFADKMKWGDWKCEANAILAVRIERKVAEMVRKRDLEYLYGKAKTKEESRCEEKGRKRLTQASPQELERMLKSSDNKPSLRAITYLFDKRGRGVLLSLLQSPKDQPRSQSCLNTDQGEDEDRGGD